MKLLLQQAVDGIATHKHPGRMLVDDEATRWLAGSGLVYAKVLAGSGDMIGFGPEGASAVGALTRALRSSSAVYRRGISHSVFAKAIADQVISLFGASSPTVDDAAVRTFEANIGAWWNGVTGPRRHLIPCTVVPGAAADVVVGPVTFVHASRIVGHPLGLEQDHFLTDLALQNIGRALAERAAAWIAIVEIAGCHPSRSSEIADLSVDVALTALQLIVPLTHSRDMARLTARTAPPWRGNLTITDTEISPGVENNQPGLGLLAADFGTMVSSGQPVLDAAGRRLAGFVTGKGALDCINQAWCDAAYWFHEGLAEPLDTVAVAKLETAVEVLLRAESSKGSGKRMRQAIEAVTGLAAKDPIAPGSLVTVAEFAKGLVGARSQVLHGTFSTLTAELAPERSSITELAYMLLMTFALQIDAFASSVAAADDVDALLGWIHAQRAASASAASPP